MGVFQLQCGLPRHHHPSGGLSPLLFFQGSVQQHHLPRVSISPPAVAAILSQKMSEQKCCVLLSLVEVFLGNESLPLVSEAALTGWHGMVHGLVRHESFLVSPVTRRCPLCPVRGTTPVWLSTVGFPALPWKWIPKDII